MSYLTQDGVRDVTKDLELYNRLVLSRPAHWSPLEHVATPWIENRQQPNTTLGFWRNGKYLMPALDHLPKTGNLVGWRSLRTTVETMHGEQTFS